MASRAAALLTLAIAAGTGSATAQVQAPAHAAGNRPPALLSDLVDVAHDFRDYTNEYYVADALSAFDPKTATGTVTFKRHQLVPVLAFNNMKPGLRPFAGAVFPSGEYAVDPEIPLALEFVSPRTVRVRMRTGPQVRPSAESLMLAGPPAKDTSWRYEAVAGGHRYTSAHGSVTVTTKPWHVEFRDAAGRLLTQTQHQTDYSHTLVPALPFSFLRRSSDFSRSVGAVFSLAAGEKIFGCGESFTRLDKRGQRVILWTNDANGVENERMYKPVPFFLSSRGYAMFVHTTAPATFDVGASYHGSNALFLGDDELDVFVLLGAPKDVLDEYTTLTGKSPMPPLWSFGLWMSRISYFSEEETRAVAAKLRQNRIPSDVIHLDTGWFETDWRSDYEFSKTRFKDPATMIADLKRDGFRVSLWQLPYFVPKNRLFPEILEKGLFVRDGKGRLPFEDAVLDFSNADAIRWYRDKIAALLRLGVAAIKVDFGEAAPQEGIYASGQSGFYEHNYYPLRYNKVVADVTKEVTGENIIWARSAWAGSQRYPIHWGGDAGKMDIGMAATLRGGLSLGLSGFTFWSHDIGGFFGGKAEDVYRRWVPFGMLSSHTRSHGTPPKEPWEFSPEFLAAYRRGAELKYRLMPYVYAQARDSAARGLPMVRALFVEYPEDAGSWLVEDEYLFGSDILVAPLFESGMTGRPVYLPPGRWTDYQTGKVYAAGWHTIAAGALPVVMLVRDGAAIPHIALAQSTSQMDWSALEVAVFGEGVREASALVALPSDGALHAIRLARQGASFAVATDPLRGKVRWTVRRGGWPAAR
jgi:alpha-D-xyloside xylohydrolase